METRREFITHTGGAILGASAISSLSDDLLAAPAAKAGKQPPTLVVIYLRGGADCLNIIVPHGDPHYAGYRPTIAIAPPGVTDGCLPLDDRFGLNPNMKEVHALYQKGMVAPIVQVGSPHGTRSHFDAQDFMERGAPGLKHVTTGWLNRYLHETRKSTDSSLRAFALQPLLPRSMRGMYPVLARPEQKAEEAMMAFSKIYKDESGGYRKTMSSKPGVDAKATIEEYGVRTIAQLRELTDVIDKAPASVGAYPDTQLGRQLTDIAKVIKSNRGLEVTALDYTGWDHHYEEGPVSGQMGRKLGELSAAIGAFAEDLGPRMSQVTVLVMSEFGRTVEENGNNGTDHGRGGCMLAVGGAVAEKKVFGPWTELEKKNLVDQRDVPINTDFRVIFAETLEKVFAFNAAKQGMFPEYTPASKPLEFLKNV